MRRLLILLAILLVVAVPVHAGVESDLAAVEAAQKACIDKDSSNAGMVQCSNGAYAAADKMLNRVYEAAVVQLKGGAHDVQGNAAETLRRLVASERAWIAYRDAECSFEGTSMLGGSGEGLVVADCLCVKTQERAKTLASVLEGK